LPDRAGFVRSADRSTVAAVGLGRAGKERAMERSRSRQPDPPRSAPATSVVSTRGGRRTIRVAPLRVQPRPTRALRYRSISPRPAWARERTPANAARGSAPTSCAGASRCGSMATDHPSGALTRRPHPAPVAQANAPRASCDPVTGQPQSYLRCAASAHRCRTAGPGRSRA